MEIIIPENISEITLSQFVRYEQLQERNLDNYNFIRRKVSIFANIPFKHTAHIRQVDFERILSQIDTALNTDAEFTPCFTLGGVEFGFIPDLDKITLGEYADLSEYGVKTDTLHKLMAVLFRPVVKRIGDKYSILPYTGTEEFAELLKDMPLNCANGALVFFYNLANELQKATRRYLSEELQKEMLPPTTSRLSAGIRRLKNWLETTSIS